MNARVNLLFGILALALALPWAGPLSASAVESRIGQQMNDGLAEPVTRNVDCARTGRTGKTVRYTCSLQGRLADPLRVRVDVRGGEWRAYWPPVQG